MAMAGEGAGSPARAQCGARSRRRAARPILGDPRPLDPTGAMTASPAGVTYARRLGLFSATMVVMGGIIGSGIFLNPAIVAQRVGTAPLTLAAWAAGAVIAGLGALVYA